MPKRPSKSQSLNVQAFNDIQAITGAQTGNPPILSEKRAPQKPKKKKPAAAKKPVAKKAAAKR
jgi:hypothetical protein